ncbi:hypothetical protein LRP80_29010, partial [Burkholderia pseudomallei]|nr:hypothetical protein [Burkholderia pseudomallei]
VATRARGVHAVAGKSPASGEGRHGAAPRANGATSPPLARIVRGAPIAGHGRRSCRKPRESGNVSSPRDACGFSESTRTVARAIRY